MSNWMDIVSAIESGALLICIVVVYKLITGVLNDSKEGKALLMEFIKNDLEKLQSSIERLSDKVEKE